MFSTKLVPFGDVNFLLFVVLLRMDVTEVLQLHEPRIIGTILMEHDLKDLGFKTSDSSKASSVRSNYDSSQNGQKALHVKKLFGIELTKKMSI
ncbi:hypothetical protein FCM35_KLT21797 [Carex littledalei]|uniref:Uncharacterized protein n=1 Tax=Carex littledalei TaxID=544730 RepID=A0A833QC75_9POAL|nr:hypothetical protein FCM35_KLT21797 [Carex littledalei]